MLSLAPFGLLGFVVGTGAHPLTKQAPYSSTRNTTECHLDYDRFPQEDGIRSGTIDSYGSSMNFESISLEIANSLPKHDNRIDTAKELLKAVAPGCEFGPLEDRDLGESHVVAAWHHFHGIRVDGTFSRINFNDQNETTMFNVDMYPGVAPPNPFNSTLPKLIGPHDALRSVIDNLTLPIDIEEGSLANDYGIVSIKFRERGEDHPFDRPVVVGPDPDCQFADLALTYDSPGEGEEDNGLTLHWSVDLFNLKIAAKVNPWNNQTYAVANTQEAGTSAEMPNDFLIDTIWENFTDF